MKEKTMLKAALEPVIYYSIVRGKNKPASNGYNVTSSRTFVDRPFSIFQNAPMHLCDLTIGLGQNYNYAESRVHSLLNEDVYKNQHRLPKIL